jgi:hypothetical protein
MKPLITGGMWLPWQLGVYPGLNEEMLGFVVEKIEAFFGVNL